MNRDVTQSKSRPATDGCEVTERRPEGVRLGERARVLAAGAREARELSRPPPSSAANRRALECARDGIGPAVSLYVSTRTDDRQVSFIGEEFGLLHRAMNDWLTMYAQCYGVDLDADFAVREAAEVLLRTHDAANTAQLPTCVPEQR